MKLSRTEVINYIKANPKATLRQMSRVFKKQGYVTHRGLDLNKDRLGSYLHSIGIKKIRRSKNAAWDLPYEETPSQLSLPELSDQMVREKAKEMLLELIQKM